MLLFLKKKNEADAGADAGAPGRATPVSEFIPYSCHYNPHTLLTKNGELMQTIKIAENALGLNYESAEHQATVRESIRKAIGSCIQSTHYSLWIHTLRKRVDITYQAHFKEPLALHTYEEWQEKNDWQHQYYNETYVTVIYEGQSGKLFDARQLKSMFLPHLNRRFRNRYLQEAASALEGTVDAMLKIINRHYHAQRLSVVEHTPLDDESGEPIGEPVFYSEPMEFLGYLLNLRDDPFPVPAADISFTLPTTAPVFGFNAVEAHDDDGERRYAALLSLKHYLEVPPESADRLLQAPLELIISQSFDFVPHKLALKDYKDQKRLVNLSGDQYTARVSGLDDMLRSNKGRPTDFGEQQTSIMVLADEYKDLEGQIAKVKAAFADLGLLTIREDIKLEEAFWARLPGNFEFIRRKEMINTSRIAGFCRLNRYPNGDNLDAHWGEAVTLVPTRVNSPYFFNFHQEDNGHTLFFDHNSFHDQAGQVLLNFLLTATRKFDGRLIVFDRHHSAELLFDKLGGHYHYPFQAPEGAGSLRLCPFLLEDNARNRSFLLAWCTELLTPYLHVEDTHKNTLRQVLDQLYQEPVENRHLPRFVALVATRDPALAAGFSAWHGDGEFAGLLDAAFETPEWGMALHAFSMDEAVKYPACTIALFSYLLHRMIGMLDGTPTIIVLHEAWDLLENAFFAPRLESLLEMLREHNAMVICTTSAPHAQEESHILPMLLQQCATRIHVPDDITMEYASPALLLDQADEKQLLRMDRQKGDFLLQQGDNAIPLRVNLRGMDDVQAIFAGDIKNLMAAGGRFASLPRIKR